MIIEISCPKCTKIQQIENPQAGTVFPCLSCQTLIVLSLPDSLLKETHEKPLRFTIHSGRKKKASAIVITPTERKILRDNSIFALSRWLDMTKDEIQRVLDLLNSEEAYDEFQIPKGGQFRFRNISAPKEPLKMMQRRILDRLLYRITVSNASHGFMPGRSIVTNAKFHLQTAKEIYNVDLKDAFPTVNAQWVKHLLVRYIKIPLQHLGEHIEHAALDEVIHILTSVLTFKNKLPQGSPGSGYLLNIACIKLDKYIYKLLSENQEMIIRYSRYADDLTFSSNETIPRELRQQIIKTIGKCGFKPNMNKIQYLSSSKNQRLEVTGLILEKNRVRIPRDSLEKYRQVIYVAYKLPTEEINPEKRLEINSIVAFIAMVYASVPHRILKPYRDFLEKHGGTPIGQGKKFSLTKYPKV